MLHSLFCQSQWLPLLFFFKLKLKKEEEFTNTEFYKSKVATILLQNRIFSLSLPPSRIVARASKNLMSTQSLGIVFGPTLLRAEDEMGNMAIHMVYQNQIAELMLSEYNEIFGSEEDWQTRQVTEYVHICLDA